MGEGRKGGWTNQTNRKGQGAQTERGATLVASTRRDAPATPTGFLPTASDDREYLSSRPPAISDRAASLKLLAQ